MATAERSMKAGSWAGMAGSYWRLVRPAVLAAVLFAMAAAAMVAGSEPPAWDRLAHGLLGTGLLVAGAMAMNQFVERSCDARMARTALRPLPSGRLTAAQVVVFAASASLAGIVYLAAFAGPTLAWMGGGSWVVYVLMYTPLKRLSVWQTPVGAVAGAMPVLLGAATADAVSAPLTLALFAIVFFWQFPHSAAIGWLHREEFIRGEVKAASVVDSTGRLSGLLAVGGAAGLLAASVAPWAVSTVSWTYGVVALSSGLADLGLAAGFLRSRSDASARRLRRGSLVHLIAVLIALILAVRASDG